jgi:hypothetical protein
MSGRTKTTLASSWNNQPTKIIRVPAVLADEIMGYARDLDSGNNGTIQKLMDEFIDIKRRQSRNLPRRFFTMDSTQWIVFNEFCRWLKIRKGI